VSEVEANKQLLRRFFEEVWNQKKAAAIDEFLAPDCIAYGLPDPDAILRGPAAFKQVHQVFVGAFPDIHIDVLDLIAAGDRIAARWRSIGTHLGDHLGFPATGKVVTLDGATIAVIRNGQMQEGWNMMDMGHLFESLRSGPQRM
jgi:steroid delta-isomerase-like uncharacterized protein